VKTTQQIAELFGTYYRGGRRVFGYGRWKALKWAISVVLKELRDGR